MSVYNQTMNMSELLKIVADLHHKRIEMSENDRKDLIALLKHRAQEELDYGEEIEFDSIRLIRRVTGAVGLYFS